MTDVTELAGRPVVVAGAGTAGRSAARFLTGVGARVTVADARFGPDTPADDELAALGARTVAMSELLDDDSWSATTDLMIVSPGFAPTHPLMQLVADAGLPMWGEVELAWRVDRAGMLGAPRTWLVVTGTNGKTTTTSMLAEIVDAAGLAGAACGNIGLPVLDAMQQEPRVDVLCAELSSFQLHWAPSVSPDAGVVLNIADDHLDWHGSFDAYAEAKTIALHGAIGVVGLDDRVASALPVAGRRVGFTLGAPGDDELGIVDGTLVDRAFGPDRESRELVEADVIRPPGPSGVADALAAAAIALAIGVTPEAVAAGLRGFSPGAHRGDVVATVDGVDYIDDSKATNPHAAQAAIRGHRRVILVAGGLLKGASVDELVRDTRERLAAVVAIGRDRDVIVETIARHAPEVPTVTVFTGDDGRVTVQLATATLEDALPADLTRPASSDDPDARSSATRDDEAAAVAVMERAVAIAAHLGRVVDDRPDAVLLAPAAASLDMFAGYGRRGDAFAAAARALPGAADTSGSPR
ncbi:UDP-N-acetylmuramoyl-L-alanine--D-glutamate ligase [Gordonia sp. ABSL11-1]|uniref:UDP-N-acetylmuramoyl-L-alanine--D-glutamate ligase n=1 Tax=Gordonia sp. ABSL11-1 TaxID=3053924 RepID=UPI002572CF5A|nr:UDP-N-acetylmuramoyl-L-alanine--D-glutamate ligase [Gordonia sp. ABSL11-1]MDL9944412.1 UDP-N-acetylmuramoyl-L-alanine--D-glutamate ligase [Gordonia sp. ABSL11-1]